MCVTTGPPIRGDPISHSQAHIPLKPLPPATRRKIFFPRYGVAHGRAQEPTTGSAVKFWGKSVHKNRPLVPWSNIAGSWTRGGGVRVHTAAGLCGLCGGRLPGPRWPSLLWQKGAYGLLLATEEHLSCVLLVRALALS